VLQGTHHGQMCEEHLFVAVCCSVLQCVAVCVAVYAAVCVAVCAAVYSRALIMGSCAENTFSLQYVVVCCNVLQGVLQCVFQGTHHV